MGSHEELSTAEQRVLLATLRLHPNGYGISIKHEIERETGKSLSIGSIYSTLDRLQRRKFLAAREGEPTAERGGRRKLYFTVTGAGRRILHHELNALDRLRRGALLGAPA